MYSYTYMASGASKYKRMPTCTSKENGSHPKASLSSCILLYALIRCTKMLSDRSSLNRLISDHNGPNSTSSSRCIPLLALHNRVPVDQHCRLLLCDLYILALG